MAENLRCDGVVARQRGGGGDGSGSTLISPAISALTRNAKGEEVKESIEAEGMMQRKRLLSLAKQFHLKKKMSVSALYGSMYICALCIHPIAAQCRIFLGKIS